MSLLLSAAGGGELPIGVVGWTVTLLGLLLVAAWTAYLYR